MIIGPVVGGRWSSVVSGLVPNVVPNVLIHHAVRLRLLLLLLLPIILVEQVLHAPAIVPRERRSDGRPRPVVVRLVGWVGGLSDGLVDSVVGRRVVGSLGRWVVGSLGRWVVGSAG